MFAGNCANKYSWKFKMRITNIVTGGTTYGTTNWSDIADLKIADFHPWVKAFLSAVLKNSTAGTTGYVILFDQFGNTTVSGSEGSVVCTVANVNYTAINSTPFALPTGLKDYMIQSKTTAGSMTITSAELELRIV